MSVIRHVIVHGRVQGVFFRGFTEQEALKRGLRGWVRNCRDGTVEAVFAGEEGTVSEMIETCRRGPPAAHVRTLDQRDGTADELKLSRPGELFSVLATA